MPRPIPYRVRVMRHIEDWVDVDALDRKAAEIAALYVPGVVSVFPGSAIRSDEATKPEPPPGVEDSK